MPKPLALEIQSRLIYAERLLQSKEAEGARSAGKESHAKAVRWVTQAASAINGEIRPTSGVLRSELCLLVAERTADGRVVVVSPAGPMTRSELELVQGLGDPLVLVDLLPPRAVSKGESWKLPSSAVFALTDYDTLKSSTLEATLEHVDSSSARLHLKGEVQGSALGGAGTITCEGFATFDRRGGLIDHLELNRTERAPAGTDRGRPGGQKHPQGGAPACGLAPELADKALTNVPLDTSPPRQLLQLIAPEGKYNLLHDRRWHTFWDDPRVVVLKLFDRGRVVAHCNLTMGPSVAKGKHQDPVQFRNDIKRLAQGTLHPLPGGR